MVKKLFKKDSKKLRVVIPEEKEEREKVVNEERKDLTEELEDEDLENIIAHDPYNTLNKFNFRRFSLKEANPSLEQEDINLEQSIAAIPSNVTNQPQSNTNNENNPSNVYLSTNQTENQTNPYSSNANLYGQDNNTNIQNAYQPVTGLSNITSLEQQRLNQPSINTPQRLNFHQDQEFKKEDDPWKFWDMDKNITTIDEAKKKEKERRFYQ